MPVIVNPESELGKEMAKWERPYQFQRFPAMLYKAQKKANGKIASIDVYPDLNAALTSQAYERACFAVDTFNKQNQRIVQTEYEERNAKNDGWKDSPKEAVDALEALEQAIGNAAAEANFVVQRMSAQAKNELQAANDATSDHVVDVPAPPKRPRGRPVKPKAAVVAELT